MNVRNTQSLGPNSEENCVGPVSTYMCEQNLGRQPTCELAESLNNGG